MSKNKQFDYCETDLFEWVENNGKMISTKECVNLLNKQQSTITKLKKLNNDKGKSIISLIRKNTALSVENDQLKKKAKRIEKEKEQLKRERDSWKSSTCSYMNKDSVLSMDCQIVQEALWELEKEIEFGSKREDLFFDLKEKFEKLNNHVRNW